MPRLQRHSGGARHARAPRAWPRVVGWTAGALVVAVGIGAGAVALRLENNIRTAPLTSGTTTPEAEQSRESLDVLVIGSDSRDADNAAYGVDDGGRRSDALMLVHMSEGDSRMEVLQIPRDTLLELPACEDSGYGEFPGGYGMINSALAYGESCSVAAVQELTGVQIEHFISMDFVGFRTMVEAINGLPVCLPEPMIDPYAGLDLPAGDQVLDGEQALSLARTRHAVGDGSDLARLGNQQKVMAALVQKITSAEVLARPDRLVNLLDAITKSLTVDAGLGSIGNLTALATRVNNIDAADITFVAMPSVDAPTDRNRVIPAPSAQAIFDNIAADAPLNLSALESESSDSDSANSDSADSDSAGSDSATSTSPSDGTAEPSAAPEPEVQTTTPVLVLNGTMTRGLATSTLNELTAEGFIGGGVGDFAVTEETQLLIADTAEARATAERLAKDLGYDLAPVVDVATAGVTLIIGNDFDDIQQPVVTDEVIEADARTADTQLCG